MKVIYEEPTISQQLDKLIAEATKPIKEFRLTAPELSLLCDECGYHFDKKMAYSYKQYKVFYDWGSYR